LGVIDDPVKGRKEAASKPTRDATWNWFTDDFMTRFAADDDKIIRREEPSRPIHIRGGLFLVLALPRKF
jgi:hypothetical protein